MKIDTSEIKPTGPTFALGKSFAPGTLLKGTGDDYWMAISAHKVVHLASGIVYDGGSNIGEFREIEGRLVVEE